MIFHCNQDISNFLTSVTEGLLYKIVSTMVPFTDILMVVICSEEFALNHTDNSHQTCSSAVGLIILRLNDTSPGLTAG